MYLEFIHYLTPIFRSLTAFYPLILVFGLAIAIGALLSIVMQLAPLPIARCYLQNYLKWLRMSVPFIVTIVFGKWIAGLGLLWVCFCCIQEVAQRIHLSVMIQRCLKCFSVLCLLFTIYYPDFALWLPALLFWAGCSYLMWRMKVGSFFQDLGILVILGMWIVIPIFCFVLVANLPSGGLKLGLYVLSVASSCVFGQTALTSFDHYLPPAFVYGMFEPARYHRLRWWVGLGAHSLGALAVLTVCGIVNTLSMQEALGLGAIVAVGSSLSHSLTRFFLRVSALNDLQLRQHQQMPMLSKMTPFLMTNWLIYPYFLHLT